MINPMVTLSSIVAYKPDILEGNMELPDGMDNEAMEMYILQYCGENEVRYADPGMLKKFVNIWFRANKTQFGRIWDTINADYNPLENYKRLEDSTRDISENEATEGTSTLDSKVSGSATADGTDSGTESGTNNVDKFISAFDSTSLQPRESEEGENSSNTSGTTHTESTNSSTGNQNGSNTGKRDRLENEKYNYSGHGSIGIITSQEMIKQEREIAQYDIYYYIAMKFEDEFTIPIYGRRPLNGLM